MKRIFLIFAFLGSCVASAPPFSVHSDGARVKYPTGKADLLFYETKASIESQRCSEKPCLSVRVIEAHLVFRPNVDQYGYDCSTNTVWMPKWDERWFAIAFGMCFRTHLPPMSDKEFDSAIHRALVMTNARYFGWGQ